MDGPNNTNLTLKDEQNNFDNAKENDTRSSQQQDIIPPDLIVTSDTSSDNTPRSQTESNPPALAQVPEEEVVKSSEKEESERNKKQTETTASSEAKTGKTKRKSLASARRRLDQLRHASTPQTAPELKRVQSAKTAPAKTQNDDAKPADAASARSAASLPNDAAQSISSTAQATSSPASSLADTKGTSRPPSTTQTVTSSPAPSRPASTLPPGGATAMPHSTSIPTPQPPLPAPEPADPLPPTTLKQQSKVLTLAQRGEWTQLEQLLRGMERGDPALSVTDEKTGFNALIIAAKENRLVAVERLLELGVPANERTKDNRTALHYAAAVAKEDLVKILLSKKADANIVGGAKQQLPLHMACARTNSSSTAVAMLIRGSAKEARLMQDKDGMIPLFLATENGAVAVCRELLSGLNEQQVAMKKESNGDTVLHTACRRKDFETAKTVVEAGVNVNEQNNEGATALHICAMEGDAGLTRFLQQNKANANIADKMDRSPLHLAAEKGHTALVELLVDKFKANVSARTKDGSTLMHIASRYGHPETTLAFLRKGVPLSMPNKSGAVCLHAAALRGHTTVLKALLQKGAPVDSKTKDRYTALHIAVENCKPQAIQTLLGYGADVELKGGLAQETPLHIAARITGGEKCAEMLLKSGADANAAQENGETALHIASRFGNTNMVNMLLEEGSDVTSQSKIGETALHVAVRHCHWPVAEELLQFIASKTSHLDATMLVNLQNAEGESSLHYACELIKSQAHNEFEETDIVRALLDYNGDINVHSRLTHETPVHHCARSGNADVLLEIVKHSGVTTQIALNKQARNGWSPLLFASENGHIQVLRILLQHHARVDVFDEHGKAALHLAAENGHHDAADILLKAKAFVNAKSKLGVTPLHLAAQNGFNTLVKLLVEKHGATIDALSLAKRTPLHMAAESGQMAVCSTLLQMGADANATDVHGQTPLHLAAENDHSDAVKLFLRQRKDLVSMGSANGMTFAHIAASKGSVAVIKELMRFNKAVVTTARNRANDSTTLHLAAAGGHADVVKALLEAGADADDENAEGMTALHMAAKCGHVTVLETMKDHFSLKTTSSRTGLTALHVAAHFGQIDFVREMLPRVPATIRSEAPSSKEDSDLVVDYGLTPLHQAAQSGHEGLVRLLLNSPGVQPDAPTAVTGSIPLHWAAQSGHTAIVSLLLSKSTKQLQIQDKRGRTALHLAAQNGHIDMVSLLLGQGADINGYDKGGWTPLHYASKAGHLEVVVLLTDSGANPLHVTKEGKIALCLAAAANHFEVLSYLNQMENDTHKLMEDDQFMFDLMIVGKATNNKAIEEFILASGAPVDTAAKMSRRFRLLAVKEKERARDIFLAGDYCEMMATELNAIAASTASAGSLLKAVDHRGMPFLDVLIECEQKEVVSHPSVQRYLSDVWTGHLSHWSGWRMIALFCLQVFVPPVWLILGLPMKHRFNKVPVIKFMSYLVSHIYLIVLYVLTVVYPLVPIWESGHMIPHWYEWLLLAWLSGLLVSELTNPGDRAGIGWIRVIVIGISAFGVAVHVIGIFLSHNERLECLYVRNQFFGFCLLLCFVQLLDFLSFHHLFGPWAIIIRDLMKDLTRFLVILLIFITGFTFYLSAIYRPVRAPIAPNEKAGSGDGSGGATYETPFDTFELLFFALFGLVEPENLPPVHRNPAWTPVLVKAIFGLYLIVTLIVLINLLIAMMSDTYQRIQAQSDTEWKFGRAKLFRNMKKTSTTPSPLNLFTKLITYIRVAVKHRGKICTINTQQYVDEEEGLDEEKDDDDKEMKPWSARRGTQVAPEGGFLRQRFSHGTQSLTDVVPWAEVNRKYLSMKGANERNNKNLVQNDENSIENIRRRFSKAE